MVGRVKYVCVFATLSFGLCIHFTAMGMQTEGLYQWRHHTYEDNAYLIAASSDSTDAIGKFSFECQIHSGNIKAIIHLAEENRAKFAQLIAKGMRPEIIFNGKNDVNMHVLLDNINFSEVGGWQYQFIFDASSSHVTNFSKTGSINIAIGSVYKDGTNLSAGKEEIDKFRDQCLKRPETLEKN